MSNEYDLFADKYDLLLNATPYRPFIEAYTFFEILGAIKGKRVVDLATGTGYYARACAKMDAADVLGIDIASEMITVAQQAETAEPLGVRYQAADVTQFSADKPFDIAIAVYLLHYAPHQDALQAMCNNIAANLITGGRFVTYQMKPKMPNKAGYFEKYGLILSQSNGSNGEHLTMQLNLGGEMSPEIAVYRWNKETIDQALENAGFTSIQWHQPRLSPSWQDVTDYEQDFFDDYLALPHAVVVEAVKV